MHLVAALAAGVRGAESGKAYLYQRGTSTLLTSYYTDFEATASVPQTSSGITLDSNGGAAVYVDTLCRVVVKSSTGSTIRTFTAGAKDSAVEVISDSFTGTDYASAATGVSRPTTLQSVLNRWNDSAGTSNFQVLVGGVATNLQTAVQGLGGFFFNVKHSDYGASGAGGAANDTASIQAAIDAAEDAGGGIVVFPAGTYRITDPLTIPPTVSMLGAGATATVIQMDDTTGAALSFTGATSGLFRFQFVTDLRIVCAQANTSPAIILTDAYLQLARMNIVGSATGFSSGLVVESGSTTAFHLDAEWCTFSSSAAGALPLVTLSAAISGRLSARNCSFYHTNTTQTYGVISCGSSAGLLEVSGCYIDASAATVSFTNSQIESLGDMIVSDCYLKAPSSGTGKLLRMDQIAGSGGIARESGNVVDGAGAVLYSSLDAADLDQVFLESRDGNWLDTSTTSATFTADPLNRGSELVQKTSGATLAISCSATSVLPIGHRYDITVWNDGTGGNVAVTWSTGFKGTGDNVGNNTFRTYSFISRAGPSGTVRLYQVGTPRDETE